MTEAAVYLARHPVGIVLAMLIVSLVLFALATLFAAGFAILARLAGMWGAFAGAGFVFLILAFLL